MRKFILTVAITTLVSLGLSQQSVCFAEDNDDSLVLEMNDTGDPVILLQLRLKDLGYYSYKITNYYGAFTKSALKKFQKNNKLKTTGVLDTNTYDVLYSNQAKRKTVHTVVQAVYTGSSSSTKASGNIIVAAKGSGKAPSLDGSYGALRDWFSYVDSRFSVGEVITVYAVDSGLSFKVKRLGGTMHADVEPLTAADTAKLKKAHGGVFNWARMAVIVKIDGELIAASMNGQPHAMYNIKDNNFNGHCCMHFLNSRTHGTNSTSKDHQSMVMRAAGN